MTKLEATPKPATRLGRVVDAVKLTATAMHLEVEAGDPPFAFEPGQYVALSVDFGKETIKRYYSIASAPNGSNRFELCVREPPEKPGILPHIETMKKPDSLSIWGPAGVLTLRHPPRDCLLVATGTGVAPMRSILRALYRSEGVAKEVRTTLLFGARTPEDIYYASEFQALQESGSGFRFCPTLTCAPHDWEGCRGRVMTHLADCLEQFGGDADVYVCGHMEMVKDVRHFLAAAGVEEDAVIYEKYG